MDHSIDLSQPGVMFVQVAHDAGCPGLFDNGVGCTCEPDVSVHNDEARFINTVRMTRAQRRQAQRETWKALRKAARRKGA